MLFHQFEWAWQHPNKSRRLRHKVSKKGYKETMLQYRFRVLSVMLLVGPWQRLPLTIRWLNQEYELPFPLGQQPPAHMPIAYGQVELTGKKKTAISSRAAKKREQLTAEGASDMDEEGEGEEGEGEEGEGEEGEEEEGEDKRGTSHCDVHTCYICHQV